MSLDEVADIYLPLSRLLNLYVAATRNLHAATATFLGTDTPRVPFVIGIAGSVAVAAGQTGIYPAETPGGWSLIGRCPVKPYDPDRDEPFLFHAGDRVRFHRISEAAYRASSQWGDV
jgi:hypothetical protein